MNRRGKKYYSWGSDDFEEIVRLRLLGLNYREIAREMDVTYPQLEGALEMYGMRDKVNEIRMRAIAEYRKSHSLNDTMRRYCCSEPTARKAYKMYGHEPAQEPQRTISAREANLKAKEIIMNTIKSRKRL